MADSQSKIDAAAEKAFAEAAQKKAAEAVSATPVVAKQAAAAKPASAPASAKIVAKKVATKKVPAQKPVAAKKTKSAPKKPVLSRAEGAIPPKPTPITQLKETIMATAKTTDYTAKAKELAADVQTRAKAAYDKGTELAKEAVEFQKGNLEALVESGKILAAGVQDMGRTYVEEAKGAVETVQADVKKIAAVKSPTELFQLQGEIARRNFDAAVAGASKNTEAMLKLVNDAFAPVSTRMSLAAEKFSKAA
ncbi:MAG: phasin family protein [Erythrobacter sp.]|jgi:phasin family protein